MCCIPFSLRCAAFRENVTPLEFLCGRQHVVLVTKDVYGAAEDGCMEKINFLSFGCRCVTYPFSMRTLFFQTSETNTKPKFEQKLRGTHFCVPNEGAGTVGSDLRTNSEWVSLPSHALPSPKTSLATATAKAQLFSDGKFSNAWFTCHLWLKGWLGGGKWGDDPIWRSHIFQMGWFNHHLDDSVLIDTVDGSESLHQLRLVVYPTFFTGFLYIPGGAGVLDSVLIDASSTPWKIKGWNQTSNGGGWFRWFSGFRLGDV